MRMAAYHLSSERRSLDSAGDDLVVSRLDPRYPIVSIEDAAGGRRLGWMGAAHRASSGTGSALGDDLFTTNFSGWTRHRPRRGERVLVKMNQIGTLTGTLDSHRPRPRRRIPRGDLGAIRRDRRLLPGRPGSGIRRRSDQGRLDHTVGAPRQVQSAARNREVGWSSIRRGFRPRAAGIGVRRYFNSSWICRTAYSTFISKIFFPAPPWIAARRR